MEYRRLGDSGLKVSAVALGTWLTFGGRLDQSKASDLVDRALSLGINFFDTADVYERGKGETALGSALVGVPRKDYVLASKVFFPTGPGPNDRGLSRKHIDETVFASLARLRTDYLDLLQCHRYDEETPLHETVRTMGDLVRQGRIHYWGVSMWTADQIRAAVELAHDLGVPPPISNQPVYNLLRRDIEAEILPRCRELGLGTIPYSPLAQGVLTGKYRAGKRPAGPRAADEARNQFINNYFDDESDARVERFLALADEASVKPAQLALRWILGRPGLSSVIVGATRLDQLEQNAQALDAEIPDALFEELDRVFPAAG
ncbi:MAG: aldo/keto reductase family protein [Planctomycetota bacterium]|jgi:aryl-alcohol dehydrogenase-like predicted oxidoreductase